MLRDKITGSDPDGVCRILRRVAIFRLTWPGLPEGQTGQTGMGEASTPKWTRGAGEPLRVDVFGFCVNDIDVCSPTYLLIADTPTERKAASK